MNIEHIKNAVKMLQINFSIDKTSEELEIYSKLILNRLNANNVTIEEFNCAISKFIDTKDENYNKLPNIAEILKLVGRQSKTVEQMASKETTNAFSSGGFEKGRFEHPVTNYVVQHCCGGLDGFIENYLCKFKEDKTPVSFKKKEFMQDWINCYENGCYSSDVISCRGSLSCDKSIVISSTIPVDSMLIENKKETTYIVRELGKLLKRQ